MHYDIRTNECTWLCSTRLSKIAQRRKRRALDGTEIAVRCRFAHVSVWLRRRS
jgi:hypothetical protein